MNIQLLITFIILNVVNVILQTIKSLATVKCGKGLAAIINAVAYGLYTVVLVYTVCDLPLLIKAGVVAICNLIGVFIVKWLEEKMRKDQLWKVEATVRNGDPANALVERAKYRHLSFNYIDCDKWVIFNFYCPSQKESAEVKALLKEYNAKYFVTESKVL